MGLFDAMEELFSEADMMFKKVTKISTQVTSESHKIIKQVKDGKTTITIDGEEYEKKTKGKESK